MALSLKESQVISEMADQLYSFLPGNPHPYASQTLSFPGIANTLDLAAFWPGGSKLPALTQLLSATLEHKRGRFCDLITESVRAGITYRKKKDPLVREDIERLNELVLGVGFKIPELHDTAFLDALSRRTRPAREQQPGELPQATRKALRQDLLEVSQLPPQKRGYEFERFLNALFAAYKLAPRGSFRLVGEQIDGSFQFHGETYLVEARWRDAKADERDLLGLSGTVAGKAKWSRGLFISQSGFTAEGLEAFERGKPTAIICMDGLDLYHVVEGQLDLREVIERKSRRAAETNRAFVPVRDLFLESAK